MENGVKSNKYLLLQPHASLPQTLEEGRRKQFLINNQSLISSRNFSFLVFVETFDN